MIDKGAISREDLFIEQKPSETIRLGNKQNFLPQKGICAMTLEIQWILGFVDGEGCFHVAINHHPEMALGKQIQPEFTVVQHERDVQTLNALKSFFKCGSVKKNRGNCYCYQVRGHKNLSEVIVPFFEKHKLKTKKGLDFISFREVVKMMEKGEHLTPVGLESIQKIVSTMNRKRVFLKSILSSDIDNVL